MVIPALNTLNVLRLPADITAVEAGAFAGVACQAVIVPPGCESIGSGAFAGCEELIYARVPAGVTVAQDAFAENVILDRGE